MTLLTLFIWALAFPKLRSGGPFIMPDRVIGHRGFSSPADLLRNYVIRQKDLGTFNRHYPPGFMLLLMIEDRLNIRALELLTPLFTAFTLVAINALGKSLALDDRTRLIAIGLTAFSTGLAIYASLTPTIALLPISTLAVMYFIRSLNTGSLLRRCAFGGLIAIYSFFSFTTGMLGLALAAFLVESIRTRAVSFRRTFSVLGAAIAVFVGTYVVVDFANQSAPGCRAPIGNDHRARAAHRDAGHRQVGHQRRRRP